MHHQHMAAAEALQHACLNADQVGVKYAHHLIVCTRRIGQRAQHVEQGAHTQLTPHRRGMFHRAVVSWART